MSLVDKFFTERRDDYSDLITGLVTADFTPRRRVVPSPDSRMVVQIPVHPGEPALLDTLELYLSTPEIDVERLAVLVLINGTMAEGWERIFDQVRDFVTSYPDFPLRCFVAMNETAFKTISEIRLCLAMLALKDLNGITDEGLSKVVFVSHDADMTAMAPHYFSNLGMRFCDPDLHAVGGATRFETENPLLLLLLKIEDDLYKAKLAKGKCKPKFIGNNSAFRASSYIDVGGHQRDWRRKVNCVIRDSLISKFGRGAVAYDEALWIATSDRREVACLKRGGNVAHSHVKFGQAGDYSDDYLLGNDGEVADGIDEVILDAQLSGLLWKELDMACCWSSNRYRKKQHLCKAQKLKMIADDPALLDLVATVAINFADICSNNGLQIEFDAQYGVKVL